VKKILIVGLALAVATVAAAQPEADAPVRRYDFRHLDAQIGEALFWEVCEEEGDARCVVLDAQGDVLQVRAGLAVQRRMARLIADRDLLPASQRLQIHLLSAAPGPAAIPERLGADARRALEDLAAVLGPRRFALLDSGLLEMAESASTHLAGPGGVLLDAGLRVRKVSGLDNEKLLVDVRLGVPGRGEQAPAEGAAYLRPGSLLETSLSLAAGETVVVGTSRVDGGEEGLVLLLTALR
jgi:hypothetical protein